MRHRHADLFDALACSGAMQAAAIDATTEADVYYPYPSESPKCHP